MTHANGKDDGFVGTLKNIQLNDLIQICCLSAVSTAIKVTKEEQQGTIIIQDGEIIHAVCGDISGEPAFYQILSWQCGSFETLGAIPVVEPTIAKGWQYLLLEAARKLDEGQNNKIAAKPNKSADEAEKLRVVVVDDSTVMCKILADMMNAAEDIEVVGAAHNGEEALKLIDRLAPDLITLDVNMPVMSGSTALKHIMLKNPCPVVIISSVGTESQGKILDFLRLGAVDIIGKPVSSRDMTQQREFLVAKIRMAANANLRNFRRVKPPQTLDSSDKLISSEQVCRQLVIINSGPGGYGELIHMLARLPGDPHTCYLLVQSMPLEFVIPLADYLNKISKINVLPLLNEQWLWGGRCYVANHEVPLQLIFQADQYLLRRQHGQSQNLKKGRCFNDVLEFIAGIFTGALKVVLLSGAEVVQLDGLTTVRQKGGQVLAQKTDTCMVSKPIEKVIEAQLVDLELEAGKLPQSLLSLPNG